jgi:TRAP-type C4-dicarboxylate transport system permease small subunit
VSITLVKKLSRWLEKFERGALIVVMLLLIVIADAQIIFRNLWDIGIIGADNLLRIGVLWLSLLGALLATRYGSHIGIDLLTRYLSPRIENIVERIISAFAASICIAIAWYSIELIQIEYEDGLLLFDLIPVWMSEMIIPICFGLMGLRFFIHMFVPQHEIKDELPRD